jgi:hypothetical protein
LSPSPSLSRCRVCRVPVFVYLSRLSSSPHRVLPRRPVVSLPCRLVMASPRRHLFLTLSPRRRFLLASSSRPRRHVVLSFCRIVVSWRCCFVASSFRYVTSSAHFEPVTWTCGVSGGSCGGWGLTWCPPLILMREGLGMHRCAGVSWLRWWWWWLKNDRNGKMKTNCRSTRSHD